MRELLDQMMSRPVKVSYKHSSHLEHHHYQLTWQHQHRAAVTTNTHASTKYCCTTKDCCLARIRTEPVDRGHRPKRSVQCLMYVVPYLSGDGRIHTCSHACSDRCCSAQDRKVNILWKFVSIFWGGSNGLVSPVHTVDVDWLPCA
jgi:hypothetical protein